MATAAQAVTVSNGIIKAVGKHIISEDALTCGDEGVGVEEAAEVGIIITALEVIEAGFGVLYIASTARLVKSEMEIRPG